MDPAVIAALIAGFCSIVGAAVALWNERRKLKLKKIELDFQSKKLYELGSEIENQLTVLQQNQLRDIVNKRVETYPELWKIIQHYWQHWRSEDKQLDLDWANEFLENLYQCSEQYGVFFSQAVYVKFHELRSHVRVMRNVLKQDIDLEDFHSKKLDRLWFGDSNGQTGLATELKNDLGSYRVSLLQTNILGDDTNIDSEQLPNES